MVAFLVLQIKLRYFSICDSALTIIKVQDSSYRSLCTCWTQMQNEGGRVKECLAKEHVEYKGGNGEEGREVWSPER